MIMIKDAAPLTSNPGISHLKARISMSVYLIYTFALFSIYNLIIELVLRYKNETASTTYITVVVIVIFALVFFTMIRHMKLPLSKFGFNLHNIKAAIYESLLWTFFSKNHLRYIA